MSPKARIFISYGQRKQTNETEIAKKIADELEHMGFDPYVAVQEQTLRGVKENIFQLANSEYFIFIDFKREKLLIDIVAQKVKEKGWEPTWRNEITLSRAETDLEEATTTAGPGWSNPPAKADLRVSTQRDFK